MRKYTYLLALLLFVGLANAYAQGGPGGRGQRMDPKKMAEQRANMWQEQFGLSDDQHKQVYDLLLENQEATREKMESLRGSGDREAMIAAVKEVRETLEKDLKKIFNENQWAAYEKWKEENPPMQRRRRGGGK